MLRLMTVYLNPVQSLMLQKSHTDILYLGAQAHERQESAQEDV